MRMLRASFWEDAFELGIIALHSFDSRIPILSGSMVYLQLLLACLFGLFSFAFPQLTPPKQELGITIHATPIPAFETEQPSQKRFGSLEFRGGLVLTSSYKLFGGISALRMEPDGEHFIALSDRALWLRARILYKEDRPIGITDAKVAPVLNNLGKPSPKWDTESLAVDGDTLYVGLERIHSIVRFDYGKNGFLAAGQMIAVPPEMKDLPNNKGLEALVFVPAEFRLKGTLIAISERGLTEDGNIKAFLIGRPTPGMFSVRRTDSYDISDATLLPDGDLLILERQYSLGLGIGMRIRRIRQDAIKPGALVDGSVVVEADARHEIDNMEALSVHRTPKGATILTLLSDDNLSSLQRTVLLQFTLRAR
jgi:hypothetical protein